MEVGRDYIKGLINVIGYRALWKIAEFLTIIILALVLSIEDFGIGFFVVIAVRLLTTFMRTICQETETKKIKEFFNTLSVLGPLVGFILSAIVFFLSLLLNNYLSEALRFAAAIIIFNSFAFTPVVFYTTRKEHGKLYKTYAISQFFAAVVSIIMAILGFGYASIIYGYMIFFLGNTLQLWGHFPFKLKPKISKEALVSMINFMKENQMGFGVQALIRYGLLLYVGIRFGLSDFSYLYLAYVIGFFIYENLTLFATRTFEPAFEEYAKNKDILKFNLVRVIEYLSFMIVPITVVIMMLSWEIMLYIFGNSWKAGSEILFILAFAGIFKSLAEITRLVFIGKKRSVYRIALIELFVMIISAFLTRGLGLLGIALSILFASLLSSILYIAVASRITGINLLAVSRDYFYILFSGIMTALLIGWMKEVFYIRGVSTLIFIAILGILSFMLMTFVFNKELYKRFARFIFNLVEG